MFESLRQEESEEVKKFKEYKKTPCFTTIEYKFSELAYKVKNNMFSDEELREIIIRQHQTILDYDLFLESQESRRIAQELFVNINFLKKFIEVSRIIELEYREIIAMSKIAYDYSTIPNLNPEVKELLLILATEVNKKDVTILSGIYGLSLAKEIALARRSSFKIDNCIHRVNYYLVNCGKVFSVQNIVDSFGYLYSDDRFSNLFIFTMIEVYNTELMDDNTKQMYDNISLAILYILDSLTKEDIKKVLLGYDFVLKDKQINAVRFSMNTISDNFIRIKEICKELNFVNNIKIP